MTEETRLAMLAAQQIPRSIRDTAEGCGKDREHQGRSYGVGRGVAAQNTSLETSETVCQLVKAIARCLDSPQLFRS